MAYATDTNTLKSIYEGNALKILEGTINVRANKKLHRFRHEKRQRLKQACRGAKNVNSNKRRPKTC